MIGTAYIKVVIFCAYLGITSCSSWRETRLEKIEQEALIKEENEYYKWLWDNYPEDYLLMLDSLTSLPIDSLTYPTLE